MQVCLSGHSLPHTQFNNSSQSGQGTPGAAVGQEFVLQFCVFLLDLVQSSSP